MLSKTHSIDTFFFSISILLLVFGLFILTSASLGLSVERFGHPYYYIFHQIIFGLLPGGLLLYACSKIPYFTWRRFALPLILGAIFLMFLVFVPGFGFYNAGARRWLSFGPISFQPAEFLKFAYIVYLASWLESRSKSIGSFKFGLLPFAIMSGFIASFLVLQPDIGTLAVLMATALAMFFVSGGNVKQIFILFLISLIILAALIVLEPYRMDRLKVFLNPAGDPQGAGYQINQALFALGSGGLLGLGLGQSIQNSIVPEAMGDSVFAIWGEETGFAGSILLLVLFLIFAWRGFRIAKNIDDRFASLLAVGITSWVVVQAFIHIGSIIGIMPLTGLPLPFISYGGTALLSLFCMLGLIVNFARASS